MIAVVTFIVLRIVIAKMFVKYVITMLMGLGDVFAQLPGVSIIHIKQGY